MSLAEAFIPIGFSGLEKLRGDMKAVQGELVSKLGEGLMKGLAGLGIALGIGEILKKSVEAAMEYEKTLHGLKDTLAATGQEVGENVKHFEELAESIQATTAVSKEHALALIQTGLNLGLNADQAQRFSTTALGLSKRLGIDAKEAMELLARGDDRAMLSLGRHSREIEQATTKQGKLDAINRAAAQGMEMLRGETGTAAGGWEHLKNTINELYEQMGTALLPAVNGIIDGLSGFFDWIMQLIGAVQDFGSSCQVFDWVSDSMKSLGLSCSGVLSSIKEFVEGIVFAFNNWDLVVGRLGIVLAEFFTHAYERTAWFGQQIGIFLGWFLGNWKGVLVDVANIWITIWKNNLDYLRNLFSSIWKWVKSGFKKEMTPDFTGYDPLKGFKSSIAEAPKFTKLALSDFTQQYKENDNELAKRADRWQKSMSKAKIDPKKAKEAVDATIGIHADDMTHTKKSGGQFTGLADAWKKAQESVLKNNTEKEQLAAARRTAKATEKIAAHLEKGKPQGAIAA